MNIHRTTYLCIVGGALSWCAAIVLAPLLAASSSFLGASDFLYQFFHRICHQLDSRSLHVFGEPLAVCSRCAAIYASFLIGTLIYPLIFRLRNPEFPSRGWLLVAVLPMVIDVCSGMMGIHEASEVTRIISGSIFGLVLPFFIVPGMLESIHHVQAGCSHSAHLFNKERTSQCLKSRAN